MAAVEGGRACARRSATPVGANPLVGPRGGDQGREVTVTKGEPMPPTPEPGMGYGAPDKTKHK